jgi:hypothetical protein
MVPTSAEGLGAFGGWLISIRSSVLREQEGMKIRSSIVLSV